MDSSDTPMCGWNPYINTQWVTSSFSCSTSGTHNLPKYTSLSLINPLYMYMHAYICMTTCTCGCCGRILLISENQKNNYQQRAHKLFYFWCQQLSKPMRAENYIFPVIRFPAFLMFLYLHQGGQISRWGYIYPSFYTRISLQYYYNSSTE